MTPVRFNPVATAAIQPSEDGEFVRFSDYQREHEELTAALLTIENARLAAGCPAGMELKDQIRMINTVAFRRETPDHPVYMMFSGKVPPYVDLRSLFSAVSSITNERISQTEKGYLQENDNFYTGRELTRAAIAYASANLEPDAAAAVWPWEGHTFNPSPDYLRNIVRAAALLAAEIERITRERIGFMQTVEREAEQPDDQ